MDAHTRSNCAKLASTEGQNSFDTQQVKLCKTMDVQTTKTLALLLDESAKTT